MAGTRRSTRQSATKTLKYTDDASSADDKAPARQSKKTTRPKRARDEEGAEDNEDPPLKKVAKPKPQSTQSTTKPKSSASKAAPPPTPSATNRDADGHQEVFWLLKAEPLPRYENGVNVAFSIDDLAACTEPEPWSGVRNPQARNNMQAMRKGDLGFFYHSNAKPSGVVGILRVVEEAKIDETAFDPKDAYYDKKSDKENPKWFCVGVEFVRKFERVVDLAKIKGFAKDGGPLAGMQLVTNSRLSVCRVSKDEWEFIRGLAGETETTGNAESNDTEKDGQSDGEKSDEQTEEKDTKNLTTEQET